MSQLRNSLNVTIKVVPPVMLQQRYSDEMDCDLPSKKHRK
jgi:hypothetical protein